MRSIGSTVSTRSTLRIWTTSVFATLVVGSLSTTASAKPRVPKIDWQPCENEEAEQGDGAGESEEDRLDCATVRVPLDYDRPRGKKIELALTRVPAANPGEKIGSLFVNPGGPGGSGVFFVQSGFGAILSELTGGRFDIIGFDPRGVGSSTPIRCFDSNEEQQDFLADAPFFPYERNQQRPFYNLYREYKNQCFKRKQDITRHMSTADVARDLNLLRRAVGDRKLTYLGFSYGSFIGNTYANLFPNKIRALVIDGVLNPWLWSWSLQITSDRVATQAVFDQFLELCDQAASECSLSGPQGAKVRFQELSDSLREEPFVFDDGEVYSYDVHIATATSAMYGTGQWGGEDGFASFFAQLHEAVVEGDLSAGDSAQKIWHLLKQRVKQADFYRGEDDYQNGLDAFMGNHCGDAQYPSIFPAYRAISDYAEDGSPFGLYWWWLNAVCAKWPVARDRYIGPWKTRTSAPVLVVGNYYDPATDYAGAVESSRLLTNSRLLSYAGWGHIAFGTSECATQYMLQYLIDGSLPPEGTVCPANPNPFLQQEDTETRRSQSLNIDMSSISRPPFPLFRLRN